MSRPSPSIAPRRATTWIRPPRPYNFAATVILNALASYATAVLVVLALFSSASRSAPGGSSGAAIMHGVCVIAVVGTWGWYAAASVIAVGFLARRRTAWWLPASDIAAPAPEPTPTAPLGPAARTSG
ncbi:hypothetical protein [Rathayibacter rathayi]|uniref:hypothetical protein n=1 Tax=Rathayibacter rathayi TaxID=33887 RepID=UPI0011B0C3D9|nr:hypothetical protein [Rathayibacter rathayi]